MKHISFDIFHIHQGENASQKYFISVQREK